MKRPGMSGSQAGHQPGALGPNQACGPSPYSSGEASRDQDRLDVLEALLGLRLDIRPREDSGFWIASTLA